MGDNQAQRVAMITGAGSGIGRSSAVAFAHRGDAVVVSDINDEAGAQTVALIRQEGGTACYVHADVTSEDQVSELVELTISHYGRLDYAHNNVGHGGSPALLADYPRSEWDRLILLNLTSTWLCLKHEIPHMVRQGGGAIVNTASTFGMVGVPQMCAYVASKHGIVGLTKAAAIEYANAGVRVNAICPGAIRTPQLEQYFSELSGGNVAEAEAQYIEREPIGRLGTPDEIAEAVVWLCSDAASFVTGHPMAADGGWLSQ